ncbi:response regulator [Pseudoflavitalea sp. G-6-1-2]|uniref:hybrid sensor histidine kinase/response regulator n=1 Tax=Pseudoflavitalea sp. G-6-1-2 TaxID=2728841 RepID=UPI001469FF27|nr:hybrid sensor histidine kinase/response regulator [Pseudoflavitalea sp. G-6-1-2]NML22475.1 response regulator [Pseudoflavitalea sp. G-6-1-2]
MLIIHEPVRILIIDDDEDDFFLTSTLIKETGGNFVVQWSKNYKEALDHICHKRFDLYFIDYFLGARTGLDLLKEALQTHCEAPMILLTGKGNHKVDLEAMLAGASDYLIKSDLNVEKLERSIRYALEKAKTLKALRDNEQKYRSIFEKSKDAIFLADTSLQFFAVNNATTQLLQFSAEQLSALTLYDCMPNKQSVALLGKLLAEHGEVEDLEIELRNSQQQELHCIFSATSVERPDGTKYLQGILHDITSLRKAEKNLLMSEKLAATGRLARTLAHEIRNPLTNIHLSLDHLRQELLSEDHLNYHQIILRNAKRIGAIISELLDTARPTEIILHNNVLQDILDESVGAAMDRIQLKQIQLNINYPETMVEVAADKEKLKIAFLNILINAVEAMEEGKGVLDIDLNILRNHYEVRISDNGIGIPPENLHRLFEPWFTSKRNGLGLGLAATLNILQAHQAGVDVQSTPGCGTMFVLTFRKQKIE